MKMILTLASIGFAAAAGVAFAQEDGVTQQTTVIEVPYGDVDLSQPEDHDIIMGRITFSASNACGGTPDSMLDLKSWDHYRDCRDAAIDSAVGQLQNR